MVLDENKYWSNLTTGCEVMYGADQQTTYFNYEIKFFNLNKLNTPLDKITNIPGISDPYVYIGRPSSTF